MTEATLDVQRQSTDEVFVRDMARHCAETAKGDMEEAAMLLLKRLQVSHAAYYAKRRDEIVSRALVNWARDEIRVATTDMRRMISQQRFDSSAGRRVSPEMVAEARMGWLYFPVRPGLLLKDARRADVVDAASRYLVSADVFKARGGFLKEVAARIKDDSTAVGAVLDEKSVSKIAQKHGAVIDGGSAE